MTETPQPKRNWFARHKFLSAIGALVLVIIIFGSAGGGGSSSSDTSAADTSSDTPAASDGGSTDAAPKPDMKVKAATIIKDYQDNEASADAKYKDKVLQVTGVVDKVDTELLDDNAYMVDVNGGKQWDFLSVTCHGISTETAAKLKKGDTITVVGTFDDGGDLGVDLKDCGLAS